MANRRMFSKNVVDTDLFLELPISAQALYFHLGMSGDDDGFVSAPKKIIRSVGCSESDLYSLIESGFIIKFSSGVIVITDWHANNSIKSDRYHETAYLEEKGQLLEGGNGRYMLNAQRNQGGTKMEPEVSVGKVSIGEISIDKESLDEYRGDEAEADAYTVGAEQENGLRLVGGKLGQNVVFLTADQETMLLEKMGIDVFDHYVRRLSDFIIAHPDRAPNSHYRTILKWWTEDSTT